MLCQDVREQQRTAMRQQRPHSSGRRYHVPPRAMSRTLSGRQLRTHSPFELIADSFALRWLTFDLNSSQAEGELQRHA